MENIMKTLLFIKRLFYFYLNNSISAIYSIPERNLINIRFSLISLLSMSQKQDTIHSKEKKRVAVEKKNRANFPS